MIEESTFNFFAMIGWVDKKISFNNVDEKQQVLNLNFRENHNSNLKNFKTKKPQTAKQCIDTLKESNKSNRHMIVRKSIHTFSRDFNNIVISKF